MFAPRLWSFRSGVDAELEFRWMTGPDKCNLVPMNFDGVTMRLVAKPSVSSSTVIFELSTADGSIELDSVRGTVKCLLSKGANSFDEKQGVYDIEITYSDGKVVQLFTEPSPFRVTKTVTG